MKKSTVIITWGVIISIAWCIFSYIMYATGADFSSMSRIISIIFFLIMGLILGMLHFRKKVNGGYATFGQQFQAGILMVIIVAVLTTLYFMVFLHFNPDIIDKILQQSQTDMINKNLSQDQIEMGMKWTKRLTTPLMMTISSIFMCVSLGSILCLLAAAITAKEKPFAEEDITPAQSNA